MTKLSFLPTNTLYLHRVKLVNASRRAYPSYTYFDVSKKALIINMSCADDLTVDDLNNSVSTSVLERVSAGAGANANLWPQIDRDR
jgi:hypothetical protein